MDYEKKYKEALERAKEYINSKLCLEQEKESHANAVLKTIFPELEESEDEKVRKWIIGVLEALCQNPKIHIGLSPEMMPLALAWLEKQGEQKPVTHKYNVGDTIYFNSFGEIKSMVVTNVIDTGDGNPMYEDADGNAVFEKAIVKQKSVEWSEKDEGMLQTVINRLELSKNRNASEIPYVKSCIDWLKSLSPQSQWKPSDEQMQTIDFIIDYHAFAEPKRREILKDLQRQLKAL